MAPLRNLLNMKVKFQLNEKASTAIKAIRQQIIKAVKTVITCFCPNKNTILVTDWNQRARIQVEATLG